MPWHADLGEGDPGFQSPIVTKQWERPATPHHPASIHWDVRVALHPLSQAHLVLEAFAICSRGWSGHCVEPPRVVFKLGFPLAGNDERWRELTAAMAHVVTAVERQSRFYFHTEPEHDGFRSDEDILLALDDLARLRATLLEAVSALTLRERGGGA